MMLFLLILDFQDELLILILFMKDDVISDCLMRNIDEL